MIKKCEAGYTIQELELDEPCYNCLKLCMKDGKLVGSELDPNHDKEVE